jgi:hypothetical protein
MTTQTTLAARNAIARTIGKLSTVMPTTLLVADVTTMMMYKV